MNSKRLSKLLFGLCILTALLCQPAQAEKVLRAGIIGADTSHVIAFTKLINAPDAEGDLAKVRVTAAFPGGSPDIPSSIDRVETYCDQLKEQGVEIVDSVDKLVEQSDVILLESVDGRVHLEQFRQAAVGKPVFIDKPVAASLADLLAIIQIAEETNTPWFSSSALRFCNQIRAVAEDQKVGSVLGAATTTPYKVEPHHPDLFWYSIHGVEGLFTLLGSGCEQVTRRETDAAVVVTGLWSDGRQGTVWAVKSNPAYWFLRYGEKGVATQTGFSGYGGLVEQICHFFVTRKSPIDPQETIEIVAFMEASDESKTRDGKSVAIAEVISQAKEQAARQASKSSK